MEQDVKNLGNTLVEGASQIGKYYGIIRNSFAIIIGIVAIILCSILIHKNSKYIETTGTIVDSKLCVSYPTYDSKGNKNGYSNSCKVTIKYKLKELSVNAMRMIQNYNMATNINVGLNDDGYYYKEFTVNRQYNVGDSIPIFYFINDPFTSSTTYYIPSAFGWVGIFIFSCVIIVSIIDIIALLFLKIKSSVEGASIIKKSIFG